MGPSGYWITQKGSSAHPRRSWTTRDLLNGTPIQHFSLAVGPSAQRSVQPGDGILIYWPGPGNHLFMGTFEATGPVAYHTELPEGWPYAVPLQPRCVIADPRDDRRKVACAHNSFLTSAKASEKVGLGLRYHAARRTVCMLCAILL